MVVPSFSRLVKPLSKCRTNDTTTRRTDIVRRTRVKKGPTAAGFNQNREETDCDMGKHGYTDNCSKEEACRPIDTLCPRTTRHPPEFGWTTWYGGSYLSLHFAGRRLRLPPRPLGKGQGPDICES